MGSRRKLLTGGLVAAAASVLPSAAVRAEMITATQPDAGLIALCQEFCASEAAFCAIYDDPDRALDDDACAALAAPIMRSWVGMLDRMSVAIASTPEGLAARALTLAQHSGIKPGTGTYAFAFDPDDDTVTGRLLHYLLRDAAAIGGAA